MPCLHFSFECETRKIKCNADERCRRQLDGGEPLSAPIGAEANESRHSDQKSTMVLIRNHRAFSILVDIYTAI